jgi:hypothetical protein
MVPAVRFMSLLACLSVTLCALAGAEGLVAEKPVAAPGSADDRGSLSR